MADVFCVVLGRAAEETHSSHHQQAIAFELLKAHVPSLGRRLGTLGRLNMWSFKHVVG